MARPKTIRTCHHCGAPTPRPSQRYCSRACYSIARVRDVVRLFHSHVDKTGPCWLWTARRNKLGYGTMRFHGHPSQLAHRVSWQLTHGPIPDGLCVLHRCDTPPCVNPEHLFLGTKQDNVDDMRAKGRDNYLRGEATYQRRHPEWNRRGEELPWTKITADDVRAIRTAYANGTSRSVLAKRFALRWNTIDHIVQRRSWKHVE